jgi:choline dehydrogenase-like flavoprotein
VNFTILTIIAMLVDSASQFVSQSYDFVIIGGGTAGLTLAARLTEDPDVSVSVIEAGQNRLADPNILVPGSKYRLLLERRRTRADDESAENLVASNDIYLWKFKTAPQASSGLNCAYLQKLTSPFQKTLDGRSVDLLGGKVLGGSSAVNGMMCTFATKEDIDNWAALGNEGWSFEDLKPYYHIFENYRPPPNDIAAFYETGWLDPDLHNGNGPIKTTFPRTTPSAARAWVETFNKHGLRITVDPKAGGGVGG